jgi:hypothetical protein
MVTYVAGAWPSLICYMFCQENESIPKEWNMVVCTAIVGLAQVFFVELSCCIYRDGGPDTAREGHGFPWALTKPTVSFVNLQLSCRLGEPTDISHSTRDCLLEFVLG